MTNATLRHRVADRLDGEVRQCLECGAPTEEGKPFCLWHVESMPYVAQLQARLERAVESAA
ncbi:MAG: hypothetical protein KDD82_22015 [Planctomycetes bacterium]|nr:hypothetical protein [Planctomycetota bacterium]